MGLNFFDYMALFTIGRGGTFVRDVRRHPAPTFRPGQEPRLVVGSRRGVPYHARGKNQKGSFGRHTPRYVTAEVIERLRARADAGVPADFRRDIWPMIDQEVRTVYYATLVRERRCTCDAEEFTALFAAAEPAVVPIFGDPLAIEESDAQRTVLAKFDIDPEQRLGLAEDRGAVHRRRRVLDPTVPQLAAVVSGRSKSERPARGT